MSAAEALRPTRKRGGPRPTSPPKTTLASAPPARKNRLRRIPRWLRITLTGVGFAIFFGGTSILGVFAGLWYRFRRVREEDRHDFTRKLNRSLQVFSGFLRDVGLIDYWPPRVPEAYEGRAFLLVANHPTLIDVVLLLGSFPELSCVAKASWYRSVVMGPMLRRAEYVPGPGFEEESEGDDVPVVRRMQAKLEKGIPVLVFPEGSRSPLTSLRRFHRGGIEAAIRAGVPILPLFIGNHQHFLAKGLPFWRTPPTTCDFVFEWFEPIETAGRELDSREVTRELAERYEARFARLLEERAAAGAPSSVA